MEYLKSKLLLVGRIFVTVVFLCLPFFTFADSSNFTKQISYQGKLTDQNGATVADGNYNMQFKLYNTLTGGSAVWTETLIQDDRVVVTNGLFSVMLGATSTSLTGLDFNQPLYLSINVGGTTNTASPTWDGEMTPRKTLGSVPYSFNTDKIDGLDSTAFVRTDATSTVATSSTQTLLTLNQLGSGNLLSLQNNSTSLLTVVNSGKIGSGTTTPYANMTIWSSTNGPQKILELVNTASTTRFFVTSIGRIGVRAGGGFISATTTSEAPLDIIAPPLNHTAVLTSGTSENPGIILDQQINDDPFNSYGPMLELRSHDNVNTWTNGAIIGATRANYNGELAFFTQPSNGSGGSADSQGRRTKGTGLRERMRLTGDGNLGIGTTSPYSKLSVWGVGTGSGQTFEISDSASTTRFIVHDNGFTKIIGVSSLITATTSAESPLDIYGAAPGTLLADNGTENPGLIVDQQLGGGDRFGGTIELRSHDATDDWTGAYITVSDVANDSLDYGGDLLFFTNNGAQGGTSSGDSVTGHRRTKKSTMSEVMRVTGSRNVAIGTTTPYARLSVWGKGTGSGHAFEVVDSASTTRFLIKDGGNTGISTSSPIHSLDIIGALCVGTSSGDCGSAPNVSGTIYANNVTVQPGDLAENYSSTDSLTPGDIVMTDGGENVLRATPGSQNRVIGIVSTRPGMTLGAGGVVNGRFPIALSGRVPVKVNLEGGPIQIGDKIALSSVAAVGKKSGGSDQTVALALESYNGEPEKNGMILAFVQNASGLAINNTGNSSNQSYGDFISAMSDYLAGLGAKISSGLAVFNDILADTLTIGNPEKRSGITLFDEETGDPYCLSISGGVTKTVTGKCQVVSAATLSYTKQDISTADSGKTNNGEASSTPSVDATSTGSTGN